YSDGTIATYDRAAGVMTLECGGRLMIKCEGNIAITANGPLVIKAPTATLDIQQVRLNGDLQVKGDIQATGAVSDTTGNSNHHSH
ncbi:hypothetical protein, partial [Mesorhizobium japonicum]